jgi:hypothetical protein
MFCVIQYPYNEVDFDDLTVMICGLHDVRFAIVIILSTSTGQALVNPKIQVRNVDWKQYLVYENYNFNIFSKIWL